MKRLAPVLLLVLSSCAVSSVTPDGTAPPGPTVGTGDTAGAAIDAPPACTAAACDARTTPFDVAPACEAVPLALVVDGSTHVDGSTAAALPHTAATCGGGSSPDVTYALAPDGAGEITLKVAASFPAIVSARTSCTDAVGELACGDVAPGGTELRIPVTSAGPLFVVVDGYAGTSGVFALDVAYRRATCGNGAAEAPEACDDGNLLAGDGCSPTCAFEPGGILARCPGQPFDLTGDVGQVRRLSLSGTTEAGAKTVASRSCTQAAGKNVVYALRSDVAGTAHLALDAAYAKASLHVRSDCGSTDYELACVVGAAPGAIALDVAVAKDAWFYVVVDGDVDVAGAFRLDVSVTPS